MLNNDIKVMYITAASFPEGIMDAHQALHARVPFSTNRKYFGISRPEKGHIVYNAAAEELQPGEATQYCCDTMVIKKGRYISIDIPGYRDDIPAIQKTFDQLLVTPGLDPQGYCVEWYFNDTDMRCMIRMEN